MDPFLLIGGAAALLLLGSSASAGTPPTTSPATLPSGQPAGFPTPGNYADSRKVEALFEQTGYYLGANLTPEVINYAVNSMLWHHCFYYLFEAAYGSDHGTSYWNHMERPDSMTSMGVNMGMGFPAYGPPTGTPITPITEAMVRSHYEDFCIGKSAPPPLSADEMAAAMAYAQAKQALPFMWMAAEPEVRFWIGEYFNLAGFFDAGGKLKSCAIDVMIKGGRIGVIDPVTIALLVSAGITLIPKIVELFKKAPSFDAAQVGAALSDLGATQQLKDEVASFIASGETALAATQLAGGLRRGEARAFFSPVYYPGAATDLLYVPTTSSTSSGSPGTSGSDPGPSGDFFDVATNVIDLGMAGLNLYLDVTAQEPPA